MNRWIECSQDEIHEMAAIRLETTKGSVRGRDVDDQTESDAALKSEPLRKRLR